MFKVKRIPETRASFALSFYLPSTVEFLSDCVTVTVSEAETINLIKGIIKHLTEEQRLHLLEGYCTDCGAYLGQDICYCRRDD